MLSDDKCQVIAELTGFRTLEIPEGHRVEVEIAVLTDRALSTIARVRAEETQEDPPIPKVITGTPGR